MLELINVTKVFNKNTVDEKRVLNNFNLKINDGDFITILGSNGTGKSTLFNCIGGSEEIDDGQIKLDGIDISKVKEYKRAKYIGRVFQDPLQGTCPNLTILENLSLAYMHSYNKKYLSPLNKNDYSFIKDKCKELNMGLEDRLNTPIGLLSGGQRQAITLLMATLNKPKILLLDEHTAALDPKTSEKIMNITKDIVSRNNITTLMITHNVNLAFNSGNKTIVLKNGEVFKIIEENRDAYSYKDVLSLYENNDYLDKNLIF